MLSLDMLLDALHLAQTCLVTFQGALIAPEACRGTLTGVEGPGLDAAVSSVGLLLLWQLLQASPSATFTVTSSVWRAVGPEGISPASTQQPYTLHATWLARPAPYWNFIVGQEGL